MVARIVEATVMAEVAAVTNVGRVRTDNEDYCLILDVTTGEACSPSRPNGSVGMARFQVGPLGLLLVVADGVGGNQGGGEASLIVCESLRSGAMRHLASSDANKVSIEAALLAMLTEANHEVRSQASRGMGGEEMASTAVVLYLRGSFVYLANVGDSRIYLARRGRLIQRTVDQIVPTPIGTERRNDDLLQAIGWEPVVEPALGIGLVQSRDLYVLCSDGLSNELSAGVLQRVVDSNLQSPRGCAEVLVHHAQQQGGRDNLTCIVLGVALAAEAHAAPTMLDVPVEQDEMREPRPRATIESEDLEKPTDWM